MNLVLVALEYWMSHKAPLGSFLVEMFVAGNASIEICIYNYQVVNLQEPHLQEAMSSRTMQRM